MPNKNIEWFPLIKLQVYVYNIIVAHILPRLID